jgi:hypothetical protein
MKKLLQLAAIFFGVLVFQPSFADVQGEGCCPEDQKLNDCYCLYCHYEPCYYNDWVCVDEPQYYCETCCRYEPEYYDVQECKTCKKWICNKKCKYVPRYYYKHTCGDDSQQGCCGVQGNNVNYQGNVQYNDGRSFNDGRVYNNDVRYNDGRAHNEIRVNN